MKSILLNCEKFMSTSSCLKFRTRNLIKRKVARVVTILILCLVFFLSFFSGTRFEYTVLRIAL